MRLQDNEYMHSVALPNFNSDVFNVTIFIDKLAQFKLVHFGEKGINEHLSDATLLDYSKLSQL